MKGYSENIEKQTLENSDYRRVVYTGVYAQLVLMSLKPGEEIGQESHGSDQFFRIESGKAKAVLNGGKTEYELEDDSALIVPAGTLHNIINTGTDELKLYTLYSPPVHLKDTIHSTKDDGEEDHFDGVTTER